MTFQSKSEIFAGTVPCLVLFLLLSLTASAQATTVPSAANLRATVYSPGVFEIFWDREPMALSYEVYQTDGTLLGITDGTSYFFDQNPAFDGSSASLDVITIDGAGNRSSIAFLLVEIDEATSDGDSTNGEAQELFSIEGGLFMLRQINQLVLGNPGNQEVLDRFRQISDELHSPSDLWDKGFVIVPISSNSFEGVSSSRTRVDCPNGGSYEVVKLSTRSGRNVVHEYEMVGCNFDGVRHTGRVFSFTNENTVNPNFSGTFSDYTLEYTDGRRVTLDTGWRQPDQDIYSQSINLISNASTTIGGSRSHLLRGGYTITEADGNTTIVENSVYDWFNPINAPNCLQLSMRITAAWTGYQTLQVDTYDENWDKAAMCDDSPNHPYLNSGFISISDGTGRSITLEPDGETSYSLLATDTPNSSSRLYGISWSENECTLAGNDESVSCEGPPPLY